MSRSPKSTCCRSVPRCARCPVLLLAEPRSRAATRAPVAALVEEILRGQHPALPDPVTNALVALARAREDAEQTPALGRAPAG